MKPKDVLAENTICVAMASDQRYAPGLFCAACTLLLHLDPNASVALHVLDDGILEATWNRFSTLVGRLHPSVHLVRLPIAGLLPDGLPPHRTGSVATYARLLLPSLLGVDRVIYLDVDLLVARDISALWTTDLQGCFAAAAPDAGIRVLRNDWPWPVPEGVDLSTPYFNAGVMVMDLEAWRREQIPGKTLDMIRSAPDRCRYWDQTALNRTLLGKIRYVDQAWNCASWLWERLGCEPSGYMIHYLGGAPWLSYHESGGHLLFRKVMVVLGERSWQNAGWYSKVVCRWGALLLAPLLPAYYNARAWLCRRGGDPNQARLYSDAAREWRGKVTGSVAPGCDRSLQVRRINAFVRQLAEKADLGKGKSA